MNWHGKVPAPYVLRRSTAGATAWLFPADPPFDVFRILLLNSLVLMFFLYLGVFLIETGSSDYEVWADALVSGRSLAENSALAWRDIGYPLILVIGGFPWTHSFLGLTIVIHVTQAGGNCGDPGDNLLHHVGSRCSGSKTCDYLFDRRMLRDAGPACRQEFRIEWTCAPGGPPLRQRWSPVPVHGTLLRIACP